MNQEDKKIGAKKSVGGISIRWKLAGYMVFFAALILVITWIFQVFLLDVFFRYVKKEQMREVADELVMHVGDESIEMRAYADAVEYSLGITVFRLEEEGLIRLVNVDATGNNSIMMLSNERLHYFYKKALSNGGSCFERITFGGFEAETNDWLNDAFSDREEDGKDRHDQNHVRLVYFLLERDPNTSRPLMVVLETGLQPLESTVQTLHMQFVWIFAIIIIVAFITTFLMYRYISKPLMNMNESAKQLARGNYNVEFSGKGYRETRELAATLNHASHELSQLDRLQKELISNISHDLRTPLTMIKGYSEIMRDLPGENTPENMQVIIDETSRLSDLVNDLLDLSRIQSGARKEIAEVFDLTQAVREVMNRYEALTRHQGYQIEFEADCSTCVYADRSMILQVIYNLINNAINYTGEDKRVTVSQTIANGNVRISVCDTGEGISPEQMPMIWNRYYKVEKAHRRAMIGTGLGLSIVKEILDLHQAAYGVNSSPGEGSVFWFELPTVPSCDHITALNNNTEE